jgi:hypothetical protein
VRPAGAGEEWAMKIERKIRIFIHVPTGDAKVWRNEDRMVSQIPQLGEYVCLGPSERWHRVIAVVHCAFDQSSEHYDAEIYTESRAVGLRDFDPPLSNR